MASQSATQRAVPLAARHDLQCHAAEYLGQPCWVVKDPVSLKYVRLPPEQYEILNLLDGEISLDDLHAAFHRKFPQQDKSRSQLQQAVFELYQQGLAWSTRPGQGHALRQQGEEQSWKRSKQALTNLLYIKLPGFDPTAILDAGYGLAKWIFHPAIIIWATVVILYSWLILLTHSGELLQRLPSMEALATWQNAMSLWLVIGATKIIHELGHAFACRHANGECHEIGVALLIFSPCLYCDVSDSWTLRSKWARIGIALAGVYIELLMASLAFFVWWNSSPGWINHTCFLIFVVSNVSTLLFNLNPLLRLDGYYILSDWLEVPNLRQRSSAVVDSFILQTMFGITVAEDRIPSRTRLLFLTYAIASAIYRLFLVLVISWMLYSVLKPFRMEYFGLFVGLVSVVVGIGVWAKRVSAKFKRHRDQMKNKKSRWQFATISVVIVLAFIFFVPIPISMRAPVQLEIADGQPLYSTVAGTLAKINVRPGQAVHAGDLLFEIENADASVQLQSLLTERNVLTIELRKQQSLGDAKKTSIIFESLKSLEAEILDQQTHVQRLSIRAPCDGFVVEPPTTETKPYSRHELPRWDGTPLNPVNQGCQIEPRAHLLTVAPSRRLVAIMLVSQLDLHTIQIGQNVRVKLDHLPHSTIFGRIDRIAFSTTTEEEFSIVSGSMEHKISRSASTQMPAMYQAIVTIDQGDHWMLPGLQGTAKVAIDSQTTAEWIWRNVNSTFNFKM